MPHSPLASPAATRAALERYGLYTKHHLGQNFLVNDAVIGKILALAELSHADAVLEVGPGLGTLTWALLSQAGSVRSLEADRSLEPVLSDLSACVKRGLAPFDTNCAEGEDALADATFEYVLGDALKLIPKAAGEPSHLVSNLPYQVAATIILQAFETLPSVRREVVMVQKEVADRICAAPGSKAYGAYTAKLALYAAVTGRFEVGPGNFMPSPHVDSAVVRMDRRLPVHPETGEELTSAQVAHACAVIDAAFAQRRKTIRNSMAAKGYDKAELDEAFARTGIAPTARAETLSPQDFVRLSSFLRQRD